MLGPDKPPSYLCSRFINMFTSLGSIFTLLFIAIDRYRKVCLPFKRQLHMRHMKVFIVPVIMGGALLFAWPSLLVYGLRSAETGYPGLRGRDCSAAEALRGTLFPLIFNSVLFGGFIVIVAALAGLYFQVLRGVRRLNRNRLMRSRRSANGSDSAGSLTSTPRHAREMRRNEYREKQRQKDKAREPVLNEDIAEDHICVESLKNSCKEKGGGKGGGEGSEGIEDSTLKCNSQEESLHIKTVKGIMASGNSYRVDIHSGYGDEYGDNSCFHRDANHICSMDKAHCVTISKQDEPEAPDKSPNCETSLDLALRNRQKDTGVAREESKFLKCSRRHFKRQFSFPVARTYHKFDEPDVTSSSSAPENSRKSPLMKILRGSLYSGSQISDSCPILHHVTSGELTPGRSNGGYSFSPSVKKLSGTCGRRQIARDVVQGQHVTLKDFDTTETVTSSPNYKLHELKSPKPIRHFHVTVVKKEKCETNGLKKLQHDPSERSRLSPKCTFDLYRYSEETEKCDHFICGHKLSTSRKDKILRFDIDTKTNLETPEENRITVDISLCPEKDKNFDENFSSALLTENGRNGIRKVEDPMTCGGEKISGKSTAISRNSAYSEPGEIPPGVKSKKSVLSMNRSRVFRPLSMCRSNCRDVETSSPPATAMATASKPELAVEAAASSSSFAVSLASSCTLDSHYSRVSSSPPDDFERSTSSSATLSSYPRHRHNDSRKLRGHRGHGPRSRTTTIALLVTLIFVASFLPHLCLQAAQLVNEGFAANLGGSASLAYNTFLRSYFINSAANPVLYGILNVKFSAEVRALIGRG
ncbi:hypothetical protein RRG08_032859 [Elysia crispata]|uniref:G-protein coupled receptors family 1 profile domain-containing protein n=1 Tax=Elysia crispata TaxID=231223 RepID=A0AAE1DHI4_9GAST|nr:hypothetical protein RRG08_032859 [Elysia crispata]